PSDSDADPHSSGTESDPDTPIRRLTHRRYRTMPSSAATTLAAAAATHQPGKAPVLFDTTPAGLTAFGRAAKLFFLTKKITEDALKIEFVAAGLQHFPELHNWYLSNADTLEGGKYDAFLAELQRRALPRDFVWDEKGRVRALKQGETDFEDWLDEARTRQLSLTDKVYPKREFIETLLYNMDEELSAVLRRGAALKGSGFHVDDLSVAAFSSSPAVHGAIDYDKFDAEARDEWNRIAARRRSNVAQVKSLSRRVAGVSVLSPSSKSSTSRMAAITTTASSTGTGARPPPLTPRERDWLAA
ncbi:hypothetical protein JCM3770_006411, partial [Rhodotorula araucariae]